MMENGLRREHALILLIAALQGAGGVTLAAMAAHVEASANLATASQFLMIHACAAIAVTVATRSGLTLRPLGLAATAGFVIGAALFAADVAMRAYLGHRLFPFAAPTGGMLLIIGWLLVAIAALAARR